MEKKRKIECMQVLTGSQESNEFIVLGLKDSPIVLADHRVVQHGAAVLSSEMKVSGKGYVRKEEEIARELTASLSWMETRPISSRVLTRSRLPQYDRSIPMVTARWCGRNQLVSIVGMYASAWVPVACCPTQ
jgi:hypothetical protein